MNLEDLNDAPHRRYNPLTREWVLVSPHRTRRPWQGQVERVPEERLPEFDPDCYLCPGNPRAGGKRNPAYSGTFVFDNDFAALLPETPVLEMNERELIVARGERGVCRVVCFSPRHDLTLGRMESAAIRDVVDTWTAQYQELAANPELGYVLIFENRGEMMGCSNPHPHCQIWATASLPNEAAKEQIALADYRTLNGSCLLCDYLALEHRTGERVVCENDHFTAVVPFWAVWPFETLLIARQHRTALDEITSGERDALADVLKRLTTRYDNLFQVSFPYSLGFHQRPAGGEAHPECHLHAHFLPPLLR